MHFIPMYYNIGVAWPGRIIVEFKISVVFREGRSCINATIIYIIVFNMALVY